MKKAYISLGSNLGDSKLLIQSALTMLQSLRNVYFFKRSQLYETTPISDLPQNNFINAVCRLHTTMSPEKLLACMQKIEIHLGKTPKLKNAPRMIDLDLLFFENEVRNTPFLTLPHPEWKNRLFVLQPLLDIETTLFFQESHQLTCINIQQLVESLKSSSQKVRVIHE